MKKKFKAFSAPPFVLKAVMAGQVGESHLLGITISSLQVGRRDWSIGMSRHEIIFFSRFEDSCLRCAQWQAIVLPGC